jgi:hypothetical protein
MSPIRQALCPYLYLIPDKDENIQGLLLTFQKYMSGLKINKNYIKLTENRSVVDENGDYDNKGAGRIILN